MRTLRFWLGVGLLGLVTLLAGLALDAVIHARNPLLAHQEGIFTLSNPGHLLLLVGIGLAVGGVSGATWCVLATPLQRLGLVALVLAASSAAGATALWAGTQEKPAEHAVHTAAVADAGHQHPAPGGPAASAQQIEAAAQLVAATREGARPFADQRAALAAGYRAVTPPFLPVVHFVNSAYMNDAMILDSHHPQSLIYVNTSHGPVLAAAMYLMPRPGMHGPAVGGPLTPWHLHTNLCFAVDSAMIVGVAGPGGACRDGAQNRVTPEMLHVWLVDNPDGPFTSDMNPAALSTLINS